MNHIQTIIFCMLLLGTSFYSERSESCYTGGKKEPSKISTQARKPNQSAQSFDESIKFGGNDQSKHSTEAVIANLLKGYLETDDTSIISIPVILNDSGIRPFGDGQTNATLDLGTQELQANIPKVVGIKTLKNGENVFNFVFDKNLKIEKYQTKLLSDNWVLIQPEGWSDGFYFNFEPQTLTIEEMRKGMPENLKKFPSPILFDKKTSQDLGSILEKASYTAFDYADNVHGLVGNRRTAVGGVTTWGNFSLFKHLYTCFDARNIEEEKKFGVPSGAGWHLVGDAAETISNSIGEKKLLIALGRKIPENISNGKLPYKLTHSIVGKYLKPKEVFWTNKNQFHWYAINSNDKVCTEIMVHKCEPTISNNWGFNCDKK